MDRLHVNETFWAQGLGILTSEDRSLLESVLSALPLAADISRSDVFLVFPGEAFEVCAAVHAQPHSMTSLYTESPAGECRPSSERRWMWTAVTRGLRRQRIVPEVFEERPEVGQQVWPVLNAHKQPIGAMAIYTNAIERERHRRRDGSFQRSLTRFLHMVAAGEIRSVEKVPPFREQDGIIFIDHLGRYHYLSGQANNVYRRLGYVDDLRGRSLTEVAAGDLRIVQQAWDEGVCVFSEERVRERILLRSAIPLFGQPDLNLLQRLSPSQRVGERYGALLLVKDVTETRRKAQELKVKAVMLKEVHHRVKNNLQMLVSIMRMQARRAHAEEARQLLYESINRVLSMSVIHESLSEGEDQVLNLGDVVKRIVAQVHAGTVGSSRDIRFIVAEADGVMLPTNKATACALVVNELLLNAVEHGFEGQAQGKVLVYLRDQMEGVYLEVADNGQGLPDDFSMDSGTHLGLDIVRTLVQDDLKGTFELIPQAKSGTRAVVNFPKGAVGGAPT
ncbi:MAG: hypothetical protein GY759_03855 [Chloroflexi bacterium]|nr:hypothetical protein [Chloroflexota bacterium]